jgi:hypothetical protein
MLQTTCGDASMRDAATQILENQNARADEWPPGASRFSSLFNVAAIGGK